VGTQSHGPKVRENYGSRVASDRELEY